MKKLFLILCVALCGYGADAERIVFMHTNDTHSTIDPDADGLGGVARRKVLIDSIKAANPYSYLIDAGDAVQGTAYFNLYKGEVEAKMLNALGYDLVTLGNHEFDNGMDMLAKYIKSLDAAVMSTNYHFDGTPVEGLVMKYTTIEVPPASTVGDNPSTAQDSKPVRIGLLAINVDPAGMIAPEKSEGLVYLDALKAANATAWHLKNNEDCDYVIAITHVGYDYDEAVDDKDIARATGEIDAIIGAHSHTRIAPGTTYPNADGKPVLIAQTGSNGKYLGVLTIDTDAKSISDTLIAVDSRLDSRVDPEMEALIAPYRQGVDSLKSIVIGKTRIDTDDRKSDALVKFVATFTAARAAELAPGRKIDIAVANRGGIRTGMKKGNVTRGQIMEMLPFDNRVVVLELSGRDLLEAFAINSRTGRVGFDRNVVLTQSAEGADMSATIDGKPVDPDATYTVATIDYIANGGDYMKPMKNGKEIARSSRIMNEDVMDYISRLPKKTISN